VSDVEEARCVGEKKKKRARGLREQVFIDTRREENPFARDSAGGFGGKERRRGCCLSDSHMDPGAWHQEGPGDILIKYLISF